MEHKSLVCDSPVAPPSKLELLISDSANIRREAETIADRVWSLAAHIGVDLPPSSSETLAKQQPTGLLNILGDSQDAIERQHSNIADALDLLEEAIKHTGHND